MCKSLEFIRGSDQDSIKGCGKIKFEKGNLVGECPNPIDYYEFDKKRFTSMLEDFRKGWNYYLSVLEIDILEHKIS